MSFSRLVKHLSRSDGIKRSFGQTTFNKAAFNIRKTVNGNDFLHVDWTDKSEDRYPFGWLRDNCQCPECHHPVSKSRQVLLKTLDPHIKPKSVVFDKNKVRLSLFLLRPALGELLLNYQKVNVVWPDGHLSSYEADWLRERAFRPGNARARRKSLERGKPKLWRYG